MGTIATLEKGGKKAVKAASAGFGLTKDEFVMPQQGKKGDKGNGNSTDMVMVVQLKNHD